MIQSRESVQISVRSSMGNWTDLMDVTVKWQECLTANFLATGRLNIYQHNAAKRRYLRRIARQKGLPWEHIK